MCRPILKRKFLTKLLSGISEHSAGFWTMKGNNSFHKIRTGDYQIIYEIHDDRLVILIVKVGHRKDVYKSLKKSGKN